jgi:hypothetical protein
MRSSRDHYLEVLNFGRFLRLESQVSNCPPDFPAGNILPEVRSAQIKKGAGHSRSGIQITSAQMRLECQRV